MKKFVFAVQVFGVIALFPIYVVLEMNHGIAQLPGNMSHQVVTGQVEEPAIQVSQDDNVQNEISIPGKMLVGTMLRLVRTK